MAYTEEEKVKHPARAEIYALLCPDTNAIRYIGKANNSNSRLKTHLRDCYRRDYPVYRWIRKLLKDNKLPVLKILKISNNWKADEIDLISFHKKAGAKLLNVALGGDEPFCSLTIRANNGRQVAAAIHSDPVKKRLWRLKMDLTSMLLMFKRKGMVVEYNKILKKASEYPDVFSFLSKYEPI